MRDPYYAGKWPPYVDFGRPGKLRTNHHGVPLQVKVPAPANVKKLALDAIRRHNSLEVELQETNRVLLRWSENAGTGMPNPDAETRETHYDPLTPDVQVRVTEIVDASPWAEFTRKTYLSTVSGKSLAEQLGISRTKFYSDWRSSLWFYRGRFEAERIYA